VQGGYDGQLSARGETLELRDAEGQLIHSLSFAGDPTPAQVALRVSEINYHPVDPSEAELTALPGVTASDFEWIELVNTGDETLDLSGASFTEGIEYLFSSGVTLAAGERLVLVKNTVAFELRYGTGTRVVGTYSGQLSNGGERLQITDVSGENILDFSWNDKWYPPSDGAGHTLVIRDTGVAFNAYDEPLSWGISESLHGSPGVADSKYYVHFEGWRYDEFTSSERADPLIGMEDSDADGDGLSNWAEYCYGTNPRVADRATGEAVVVSSGGERYMAMSLTRRRDAYDVAWSLRSCENLVNWVDESSVIDGEPVSVGAGLEKITLRTNVKISDGGKKFFRMQGVRQ
jgi:hypothetical protein